MRFKIQKQSAKSNARLGIITTPHGPIETPALLPCATQASIKTLSSEETLQAGTQTIICNTFHLHLKPGENIIKKSGGLRQFMNWPGPIMTDSAGFQVFSLGFGRDHGLGKFGSVKTKKSTNRKQIKTGQQPKLLKITDDGVLFTSPHDGHQLFIGPKESITIQEVLGADIIFAFDECTPPLADEKYTEQSLVKTHRWAQKCLDTKTTDQAIYGIVQGGRFKNLRLQGSEFIGQLPFDGFGVGGELGLNKKNMEDVINWSLARLPRAKPRHMLGTGHLEDIPILVKSGIDTFDTIVPTHYARHGTAFVSKKPFSQKPAQNNFNKIDLSKSKFLTDQQPLDPNCSCPVCENYKRNYLCHLIRAKEMLGLRLLSLHNLYFFNAFIENLRQQIKTGTI